MLVGSLIALALACAAALSLAPSFAALQMLGDEGPEQKLERGEESGSAVTVSRTLIEESRPILAATSSPSRAIASMLAHKPAGMRIERIAYTAGPAGEARLVVSGAAARGHVSAFRAALASDARFESVNVPVGALIGAEGGAFQFTIVGSF